MYQVWSTNEARRSLFALAATILAVAGVDSAAAATITVGSGGAPDAPTLSAGVAMASDGDVIEVESGTYMELVATSKALTIKAVDGVGTVTVNAQNFDSALAFEDVTGAVVLDGLVFQNGGGDRGGGVLIDNVSGGVTVKNCEFWGNLTDRTGGAIDAIDTAVVVDNCLFEGNGVSGSNEQRGGAINLRGWNDGSVIKNCTFNDNSAEQGGAVYCKGEVEFDNNTFEGNTADRGAAVYGTSLTDCVFRSCTFETNVATENGGAVYAAGSGLTILYCLFDTNSATDYGGGVYLSGGSTTTIRWNIFDSNSSNKGGGLAVAGMLQALQQNTFHANSATAEGAGLYIQQTSADIMANVFTSSTGADAVFCEVTATPTFTCTMVDSNAAGDFDGCGTVLGTNGNQSADPQYCDAGNDDYRIDSGSAAAPDSAPSECAGDLIGAGGIGCGTTAVEIMSWGEVKSRFTDGE